MSYDFVPGRLYRMPTHFGPSLGPRQGEGDRRFACRDTPKTLTLSVSFLTRREQLGQLLPEGFTVGAEPVVTVAASYMRQIEWLAGRGYNILGVSFPALFQGRRDRAAGEFLAVLWENMCDPILTGRDELGYAKIWAEIPEPRSLGGKIECSASWDGFRFLTMEVGDLVAAPPPDAAADDGALRGTLHYKYIPRTGDWGRADAAYAVLTPAAVPNCVVEEYAVGAGSVQFRRARWEDMPTQSSIVNALADLEILEYRGARRVRSTGGKDLRDQRILE